ncbi:MAG: GntR family transcriptional regulator [Candidatus Omnitrophica bacterium]|nr:GntR family transcriptional regulator [Candidatus Omnitrophota bacterium]MCM8816869.1 GntR family transcriptional regulator [Candidatus Omnitrophota bacterium]
MIKINKKSYKPITYQIKESLKSLIHEGKLKQGEILPSVKYFEKKLGVSFKPIRSALLELKKEGLVYSRKGVGWFVAQDFVKVEKSVTRRETPPLHETVINMPLPYILIKKTIKICLLDRHPEQIQIWRMVFSQIQDELKTFTFTIEPGREEADINQVRFADLRNNPESFIDLGEFKSINEINFNDIYKVLIKGVVNQNRIYGLPASVGLPILYFNKNFRRYFSLLVNTEKTKLTWKQYLQACKSFRTKTHNFDNGFILSSFSPFYYFVLNGVEPFYVENGRLILNLNDEKFLRVMTDLEFMARNKCYIDRSIYLKMADPKEMFLKSRIPLLESFIFYSHWLKDRGLRFCILPLPVDYNENFKIPVNCSYWAIPTSCNQYTLCAEIVARILSPEIQKIIARRNQFPVLRSVATSSFFLPPADYNKEIQIFHVENGENYDVRDPIFHAYLYGVFNLELDRFINDQQCMKETIENLQLAAANENKSTVQTFIKKGNV